MTAEELWRKSGLTAQYESWSFGDAPDKLAALVKNGVKTATCSAYDLYQTEGEPIPKAGDYSVILDSKGEAICIVKTTKVYVTAFDQVSQEHAYKEGEGDRSLAYWRKVHIDFLTRELAEINKAFTNVDMFLHERTPRCTKRRICSYPALGEQVWGMCQ